MINLYEWPPTRSNRVKWAILELGLEFKSVVVDMTKKQQHTPEYRALQPLGAVPAISTDTYSMFESVAIVMQLIDEHPESGFAPQAGTPDRAAYYQWCVFAGAELDPALMTVFDNSMRPLHAMRPEGRKHNQEFTDIGRFLFNERASALSEGLSGRKFILGDAFSGADIAVGHSLDMANRMQLLADFPILCRYYERLKRRPCCVDVYKS